MATKSQTNPEWAVEVWNALTQQAQVRRAPITYSDLRDQVGHGSSRLGKILEYILQYCKLHRLPKLTVIVVEKGTGVPGSGMDPFTEVDYREVYSYDWQNLPTPTADDFQEAVRISQGETPEHKFRNIRNQINPLPSRKNNESD